MRHHQITYIRDGDRTRVIFSFPVRYTTLSEALAWAGEMAPVGFRHCATKPNHDGRMRVPMDGDDYGMQHELPREPPTGVGIPETEGSRFWPRWRRT